MSKRTVLNEKYTGLVDTYSIPADIYMRNGKKYATFGTAIPIHSCTDEEIAAFAVKTHHYTDIFTEDLLAPLGELIYVRIDDVTAEKVFVNRNKKILIWSADGKMAAWRCAPTFESNNQYIAGTPIVNKDGALVSIVTAKKGNHYAISSFEGEGGYFETNKNWQIFNTAEDKHIYGNKSFETREDLVAYIKTLPEMELKGDGIPVCHQSKVPRICLVSQNGRQVSHSYLSTVTVQAEYL